MRIIAAVVGLLVGLASTPVGATVIFDTIHPTVTLGATRIILPGAPSTTTLGSAALTRGGPLGMSFNTTGNFVINQIDLQVNANTPSDGGAMQVFIVANSGGSPGIAGSPTFTGSGPGLVLTNATLFGTISDSLLTTAGLGNASATMPVVGSLVVGPGEHWLVLENTAGLVTGTAKWVSDLAPFTTGTGTVGQSVFWQAGPNGDPCAGTPCTFSDAPGVNLFEARITGAEAAVPEPATITLLGIGLVGIGLLRRRHF